MWPSTACKRVTRCLQAVLVTAIIAMGMLVPTGTLAHAVLKNSAPAANQTLQRLPAEIELHFSEPVRLIRATATDGNGTNQVLDADTSGADVRLHFSDPSILGTVMVSYRVESEDGHPVGGTLAFTVGTPSAKPPVAVGGRADLSLPIAIWFVHIATVLFLAFAVGGALFDRWLGPGNSPAAGAATVMLPGTALLAAGLYLQGLDEAGNGLVFAGATPLNIAVQSNAAICASLFFLSLFTIALPLARRKTTGRVLALVALILAASAFTFSGHCSVADPRWVAKTAIFLHSATLLFWTGSLLPLWQLSRAPLALRPLSSFSRVIPVPFFVMIFAGSVLAMVELPTLIQILSSLYGRILAVKVVLVICLCMVAVYNRFWLTGPTLVGDPVARERLRRSIVFEIILAVAIIGTAGLWRFAGPEQVAAAQVSPVLSIHLHSEKVMAQLELGAEAHGARKVHVAIMAPDFDVLDPRQVVLRLKRPTSAIEPIKFELTKAPEGGWEVEGVPVRDPKGWLADLEVLVDDFHAVHLESELSD